MSIKTITQLSIVALAVGAVLWFTLAEAAKNFNSSKSNTSTAYALPGGESAKAEFSYDLRVTINQDEPPSPALRAAIVKEICAQAKEDLFRD